MPGCDGAASAKRSYPKSEVRGGGWEELPHVQGVAAAQAQPRGATPRPRSGAEARRTPCPRGGSQEELPTSEVRGSGREEQPHVQGAVAAQAQEGLEELFHVQGQEG